MVNSRASARPAAGLMSRNASFGWDKQAMDSVARFPSAENRKSTCFLKSGSPHLAASGWEVVVSCAHSPGCFAPAMALQVLV